MAKVAAWAGRMTGRRGALAALLVAAGLLASSGLYLAAYLGRPSDGTVIDVVRIPSQPGIVVGVHRPGSALQPGDQVVAVNGQTIDAWIGQALRQPLQRPPVSNALDYTVVRAGQILTVRQSLLPPPLATVLGENWTTFFFLVYLQAICVFVFARRPTLLPARMLLVFGSSIAASSLMFFLGLPLSGLRYGWLAWLWLWGTIGVYGFLAGHGLLFAMVFPRMWPALNRRPAWIGLVYLIVWLPFLGHLALAWPRLSGASAHFLLVLRATNTISVVVFPLAVVVSVISYRRTRSGAERRQMRWILWAIIVAILPWVVLTALPQALGLSPLLPPVWVGLLWCALPTAFAISILREGLFDIDVIINRSLVYGALSVVLLLAYFGGVVVLQSVFSTLTGQQRSQLATVLSTLAIAALFSPLRRRLQRYVDQRFYRRKYDTARTLTAFGATLRDDAYADLASVGQRLVEVVHDTMQPDQAWLWLRPSTSKGPQPAPPSENRAVRE